MQEDFYHHVWLHKKLALESLQTTENQSITIKSVGLPNVNSGPDFFNAQIYIDDQLWVGTVEIHLQSSDWYAHYTFKKSSSKQIKPLSKSFVDLLIINSVLPIKYAYQHVNGQDQDSIISILKSIPSEQNAIVKWFNALKPISKTALDSQALIELKNNYCDNIKCLQCGIGSVLLNRNA